MLVSHVDSELRLQNQSGRKKMSLADTPGVFRAVGPQRKARHSFSEWCEVELQALEPAAVYRVLFADPVIDAARALVKVRSVGCGREEIIVPRGEVRQRHE